MKKNKKKFYLKIVKKLWKMKIKQNEFNKKDGLVLALNKLIFLVEKKINKKDLKIFYKKHKLGK